METAKNTPTPWGYDGDGFDSIASQHCNTDGYTIFPLDEDGIACGHICEMSEAEGDAEAEANAAFICKAVNNHEPLLKACMLGRDAAAALLRAIKDAKTLDDVMTNRELRRYNGFGVKMDAAIAAATGEA